MFFEEHAKLLSEFARVSQAAGASRQLTRRRDSSGSERQEIISTDHNSYATAIPGLIKNAEGKIDGKITYVRLTIRRK